jgi:hypothetical protein
VPLGASVCQGYCWNELLGWNSAQEIVGSDPGLATLERSSTANLDFEMVSSPWTNLEHFGNGCLMNPSLGEQ